MPQVQREAQCAPIGAVGLVYNGVCKDCDTNCRRCDGMCSLIARLYPCAAADMAERGHDMLSGRDKGELVAIKAPRLLV